MSISALTRAPAILLATLLAALVVVLGAPGCSPEPAAPKHSVEISGEIRLPAGTEVSGHKVYVSLFHAWALQGELRHPLQLIESFETTPGSFVHQFEYPEADGEGLIAFAWVDLDGDGVDCTMTSRIDLSGLTEVAAFPADRVSVNIDLTEPCRGPDWFYPPRPQ